jgi:anti-anti-sigma factor
LLHRSSEGSEEPTLVVEGETPGQRVVLLRGEHDLATSAEVAGVVANVVGTCRSVVIDLSETEFIDCSIVHVLEESRDLGRARGHQVTFQIRTGSFVERVLDLTGMLDALPVYRTRADAIEASGLPDPLDLDRRIPSIGNHPDASDPLEVPTQSQ